MSCNWIGPNFLTQNTWVLVQQKAVQPKITQKKKAHHNYVFQNQIEELNVQNLKYYT